MNVRSSQDAVIGKTLDGVINSWNPAAEHLYSPDWSRVHRDQEAD